MSFASLFAGVAALNAQDQSMSAISNNISNVNTVGYKRNSADFYSLVTGSGGSGLYSPGGVAVKINSSQNEQGVLQQTGNGTDVAISGGGYFVTRRDADPLADVLYTRAGAFREDSSGNLRNTAGFVAYGWPVDASGNIPASNADITSLKPVNVSFVGGLTSATTNVNIALNLDSRQTADTATPPTQNHFSRQVTVFDSLGNSQKMTLDYTKTGTNTWQLKLSDATGTALAHTQTINFKSDGTLNNIVDNTVTPAVTNTTGKISLTGINWGNGSAAQSIDLDVSKFTQFASSYNVTSTDQNGAELGLRTGVNIDSDGNVFATFSNGKTSKLFKLAIATFSNSNGLQEQSGNAYTPTTRSGDYNLREPGKSGAGKIASSSLESSNVDLAAEFAKMIVTQRSYSAAAKVITTSNEMLQDLIRSAG